MKRGSLRPALLAVAVLLAARPAWAAIPLKDLTQEKLRDWVTLAVQAARKDPAEADAWKRLSRLVFIDTDEIVYEHDKGKPVQLLWSGVPRRVLSPDERKRADQELKKFADYALFEHDKGLVSGDDATALKAVLKVVLKPNPAPRKRPDKAPPMTVVKDLNEDTVRDWMLVAADETRKDPAWADTWKELEALVEVDPGAIIYEHDKGVPTQLHWEVTPRRALTPDERLLVEKDLKKLSDHMLFEHNKGLVPATDVESIKKVLDVEVGPNPDVAQNPPPDNPTDIEKINKAHAEEIEKLKKAQADDIEKLKAAQADEIDKIKKAQADDIEKLKKQHDADATEIEKLKKGMPEPADVEKLKKQHDADAADIEKLKKQHEADATDIEKGKAQHDADATDIEKLKKQHDADAVDIEKCKKERTDIVAEIEKLKKDQTDTLTEIEKLKKERGDAVSEYEKLKKEHAESLIEIEKLRQRSPQGPENPRTPIGPSYPIAPRWPTGCGCGSAGGYILVQPSSMIYYDYYSRYWAPGPPSVVYYPAGSASRQSELPRPPAFVAPAPAPAPGLPPPEQPRPTTQPSLEKPEASSDEAVRAFWIGYRSYWQGDYDRALASFDSAVRLDDQDARFWYYKALAERGLGDVDRAEASAKRGRELHAALKPKADLVGAALERVQGQERRFLNAPEVVNAAARDGQ